MGRALPAGTLPVAIPTQHNGLLSSALSGVFSSPLISCMPLELLQLSGMCICSYICYHVTARLKDMKKMIIFMLIFEYLAIPLKNISEVRCPLPFWSISTLTRSYNPIGSDTFRFHISNRF
ncbi:hypothetical protein M5689_021146 [Euphorbia peplus]|nr:hypothetical protein M5689_021146 [Euphorbia peplus]